MVDPHLRSLADAVATAAVPLLDSEGQALDPLLLVDLDTPVDLTALDQLVPALSRSDRILVGVSRDAPEWPDGDPRHQLAEALDLTLCTTAPGRPVPGGRTGSTALVAVVDVETATGDLTSAVLTNPQAALALKQVLRAGETLSAEDAVVLESYAYSTLLGGTEFASWLAAQRRWSPPHDVEDAVLVDRVDDDLLVRLNRPERRNAYGRQVRDGLVEALELALLDPLIARVVLDGAGTCFSAGGDLGEFGTTPDPVLAHRVRTSGGAGRLLARLADRVVVNVHGTCVGAGVELPAFAGRVVADPATTFRLPEVAMGLVPGAGGTASLPRRIGRWRTAWLGLTGATIDAATAYDWGLVDEVRPTGTDAAAAARHS